jgi:hypothetical protein
VGPKTVFATIAGEFFASVLTLADHNAINHSGIPGVPAFETFTESIHATVDHTLPPWELLDAEAHGTTDHVTSPPFLMSAASHFATSHAGIAGVNDFDVGNHSLENHAGLPGVPGPETFTEAVHAVTDHTGIPGVSPPVAPPDEAAQVIVASADGSDTVDIVLTDGTWAVFAWAAWRAYVFNQNSSSPSQLRINGVVVSTLVGTDGNPSGIEVYAHFGGSLGIPGNQTITCDFDARDTSGNNKAGRERIRAFAVRTA